MTLRAGHLFAGYDGLGMAVEAIWPDSEIAWFSDVCKFDKDGKAGHHEPHRAPCSILAHHYPDVPNLGDVTAVDWAQVEPVDILTGGSPCQDLSHAGKRAGMTEGTRSNLWVAMREAIAQLRPGLVIWENVRGAYSAAADSDMEPCSGCLGDGPDEPALRALGRVLGDLSELGYVGGWHGLRAADVGAPHGRLRVFVVAHSDHAGRGEQRRALSVRAQQPAAERGRNTALISLLPTPVSTDSADAARHTTTTGVAHAGTSLTDALRLLPTPTTTQRGVDAAAEEREGAGPNLHNAVDMLPPTPRAGDGEKGGPNQRGSSGDLMLPSAAVKLLPTPAVNDMGAAYTPDEWDAWTDRMKAEHGNGNGHGKSLNIEAQRLLPTPAASENGGNRDLENRRVTGSQFEVSDVVLDAASWGQYSAAIHRWEQITRSAPPPTETGPKDNPRLSAAFSEWLMGLPAGWVTDVPGITRNEALKALGNGVVPQQAEAAVRFLMGLLQERAA